MEAITTLMCQIFCNIALKSNAYAKWQKLQFRIRIRNRNTIEFLGIWESLYNPNFKPLEFEGFRK